MAAAEILKLLLAISFVDHVAAADSGDDFSNNLFSDLAPILTLFGERVAMQFMSQSMGWADNIIFAMAPLGIITAIVGAIRVGGPSWLKAIIGRARENLATAEMDLMSSTSKEVCELWNRQEVVRCMGSAPVIEFICLLPRTGVAEAEVKVTDLETAKEKYLSEIDLNIREDFCRWRDSRNLRKDAEKDPTDSSPPIIIIRNKSDAAPNISLNSHNQVWRGELRAAAVFGVFLQLGVLVYSGFTTYYPTLKLLKEERPIAKYAFPCTAVGTLVLIVGMLVCAHVVESSTKEERYQAGEGRKARLVWLQQEKTVNDQDFDSFVIFTKDDRTVITTSRRLGNKHATVLAFKAGLGTLISLCGFIVQFTGLRGMHWSASIAQLGAVLVMTGVRAWVRRGLAKPPTCQPLHSEFELDWFAMTFGDLENAPWLHSSKVDGERHSRPWTNGGWDWRIGTVGDPATSFEPLHPIESEPTDPKNLLKVHRVMMIRRDLGELADWHGSASQKAIALARAIEITMDALIEGPTRKFTWTLPACGGDSIHFRLERQQNGKWKAYSDEIEAALSLWLYSVNEQEQGQRRKGQKSKEAARVPRKDDAWLRAKGSPAKLSLRLLGSYTADLHQDLWWWMPRDTARIMKVEEDRDGKPGEKSGDKPEVTLEVENHRIVGCGSSPIDASRELDKRTRYRSCELAKPSFESAQEDIGEERATKAVLATESHGPLKLLYAQDMFSAFMWAAAKTLKKPLKGSADIRPDDTSGDNAWQSFTLRNNQLSQMAQDIQSTGLGSLEDIYLSMIPPLSKEHKLPQPDAIIQLAQQQAQRHEQLKHWKEAGDAYLWLFRTARRFPEQSSIATKATAVLMEFLRQLALTIELREAQYGGIILWQLKGLKSVLEKELKSVGRGTLSSFMGLYEEQGDGWKCVSVQEARTGWVEDTTYTSYPESFKRKRLHLLHRSPMYNAKKIITRALRDREDVNQKDARDWTPLHYIAAKGSADVANELLRRGADANARNLLEWTPLHYACRHNDTSFIQNLIRGGADIDAQGRDGVAPLHCAAMNGRQDMVKSLIEAGAAMNILDASGNTPLLWAAYKGHMSVVAYLWKDANKRLRDNDGRTALHLAATAGMEQVAWWLIDKGADKEAKNRARKTPLYYASMNGHEAVVRLLVETGVNKEAKDANGWTPLHWAAMNGHEAIMRLLEAGIDKEAKNSAGRTPLHWAAMIGYETIVRVLVEAGVNKEANDRYGWTPLHWAAMIGYEAVVRMLK